MTDHPGDEPTILPPEPPTPPSLSVTQLLTELEGTQGRSIHAELQEAIAEVVQAVRENGKAGKVQLTISFGSTTKFKDPVVLITPKITKKVPEEVRDPSIRFVDDDGGLHRNNPYQSQIPGLREVNDRRTA